MPQISVIMSAYNSEKYISEAIDSVLKQTYRDFEFIIVNDGSTDGTLQIINAYAEKDRRIILINQKNMGMGEALNNAIKVAKNELLIRMDADDVMLPNRIERQIDFMNSNLDIAVASCLIYYINKEGEIIGKNTSFLKNKEAFRKHVRDGKLIGLTHPGVIFRKSIIEKAGGYRSQFWPADDIDLWMRLVERGYILLVQQEYLLKYRIHGDSVSVAGIFDAREKVAWIKECINARKFGMPEPTLEQFRQLYKRKPLIYRMNKKRKDMSKVFYKIGVHFFSTKHIMKSFFYLILCFIFQPTYFLSQIRAKYAIRRTNTH